MRVYAAGDTDLFDGMAGLPSPDVALLPVWGWGPTLGPGHLDPVRAAEAVARLRPRVAVPVHWGTFALAGLVRAPGRAGRPHAPAAGRPAARVRRRGRRRRPAHRRRWSPRRGGRGAARTGRAVNTSRGLRPDWTDPAAIGYPVLVGGVLLGSVVPVVPTGAVVGAAAAVATTTGRLSLVLVVLLSTLAALLGDPVTFAVARAGSGPVACAGWPAGSTRSGSPQAREQFATRGWQLVVVGRLLPAGRIPVLLAAGALAYPWRRLLPRRGPGLPALGDRLRGARRGQRRDLRLPGVATLVATVLVLLVAAAGSLITRRRRRVGAQRRAPSRCRRRAGRGRLVRGGRVVARLLAVWALAAAALVLLDRWLAGFEMPQWWQPTVRRAAVRRALRRAVAADPAGRRCRSRCSPWASAASCCSAPGCWPSPSRCPGW